MFVLLINWGCIFSSFDNNCKLLNNNACASLLVILQRKGVYGLRLNEFSCCTDLFTEFQRKHPENDSYRTSLKSSGNVSFIRNSIHQYNLFQGLIFFLFRKI